MGRPIEHFQVISRTDAPVFDLERGDQSAIKVVIAGNFIMEFLDILPRTCHRKIFDVWRLFLNQSNPPSIQVSSHLSPAFEEIGLKALGVQ